MQASFLNPLLTPQTKHKLLTWKRNWGKVFLTMIFSFYRIVKIWLRKKRTKEDQNATKKATSLLPPIHPLKRLYVCRLFYANYIIQRFPEIVFPSWTNFRSCECVKSRCVAFFSASPLQNKKNKKKLKLFTSVTHIRVISGVARAFLDNQTKRLCYGSSMKCLLICIDGSADGTSATLHWRRQSGGRFSFNYYNL